MDLPKIARSTVAGIALFWLVAIVAVAAGVPDWWLPLALLAGLLVPAPKPVAADAAGRGLILVALLLVGVAFAIVAHGALATPSRHWDGAVAFDAKAFWLTRQLSLQQPFFADPAVFHHSPDYPLLLPLLIAATERLLGGGFGRLWLPLLWLLVLLQLVAALRRGRAAPIVQVGVVLACALTPLLLGPGGGAVDSGYADVLLLLATTTLATGLWLRSPWELLLGAILAIASKPEGPVYVGVAAVAAFVTGQRRSWVPLAFGAAAACMLWLPTQRQLLHLPAVSSPGWAVAAAVGIAVATSLAFAADALLRQRSADVGKRWLLVAALAAVGVAALPLLAGLVPADSAIGVYVHRGAKGLQGLTNLVPVAVAMVEHTLLRVQFGLLFPLLLVLAITCDRSAAAASSRSALGPFLALGLLSAALPFVLSPEPDLPHHLRSSLPRLLLHWLAPAWMWVGRRLAGVSPPNLAPAVAEVG